MTDQSVPLILVVDDYQDAREMYAEYLQFSGFRVAEARNGNEALEQAFALKPDLILMDLSLPGMDGWEATRQLKSDERTRHIPVVALTGHALAGGVPVPASRVSGAVAVGGGVISSSPGVTVRRPRRGYEAGSSCRRWRPSRAGAAGRRRSSR